MKRIVAWVCVMAVLGVACLCGCAPKVPEDSSSRISSATKAVDDDDSGTGEPLIRQDVDELVQVRIEDGQASIRLNPQRWEERYGAEFSEAGQMFGDMEFVDFSDPSFFAPIDRMDGVAIRDVCIGTVPGFSDWSMYSFPVPVAMLLREDGRVEAVFADPFATHYTSEGMMLAFLVDVESLYVDVSSGDGRGDPSIYAICADGLRYDLQYLFSHTVTNVFDVKWSCVLADSPLDAVPLTVELQLFEDSAAQLTIFDGGGLIAEYAGNHVFVLAEEQDYRPPTLVLDLALEACNRPEIQTRGDIKGSYFYEIGIQDMFLHLWQSFGDALYVDEGGTPITEYWLSGYGEHDEDYDATSDADFSHIYDGFWVTELETFGGFGNEYQGCLRFVDETSVEYEILSGDFGMIDKYIGSYSIVPDDSSPSGYLMVLELYLDWTSAEGGEGAYNGDFPRREIKGSYVAEMTNHPELYLWLRDGDALYNNQFNDLDGPQTAYTFTCTPIN
ncbi:hypothetical protein LJB76_01715 [Clostridia bacterium OttesenSCG-928-O13]|nr:hypothetical protein [Clostridia bacterium OttesenSCG-928-O13]